jgi:hypothetical protein
MLTFLSLTSISDSLIKLDMMIQHLRLLSVSTNLDQHRVPTNYSHVLLHQTLD